MFEQMCYLIVCRQKANLERRRLLYAFYAKDKNGINGVSKKKTKWYSPRLIHANKNRFELNAYRQHADFMRNIAKTIYSPLRRSLKAKMKYDSNNAVEYITYQGEQFDYKRIQEIAAGYEFDSIVLDSNKAIVNPYIKEQL